MTKQCKTCGKEKDLNQFWYNSKTKDRLKTSCIDCCKAYNKRHYEDNKELRLKQIRDWQKEKERLSLARQHKQTSP